MAFDRTDHFYITYTEHNATDLSGVLVVEAYNFPSGGAPAQTVTDTVLERWLNY